MTPSEKLVLRAVTFHLPYLMQIVDYDGDVIITIGAPQNVYKITEFHLWIGYGVDAEGVEVKPDQVFEIIGDVDRCWAKFAQIAYRIAFASVCSKIG